MAVETIINRNQPMVRDGVGGNIKATRSFASPVEKFKSPSMGGGGLVSAITSAGSLIATGFAAIIAIAIIVPPASVNATGLAPTIVQSDNKIVSPGVGALTLTGFSPVLNSSVIPGVGSLTLNGQAPVINGKIITGLGVLTLNGFPPVLNGSIITGLGAPVVTGLAPQIAVKAFPGLGQLTINGLAPILSGKLVIGLGQLTVNGLAPSVLVGTFVNAGLGQLNVNGLAPVVLNPNNSYVNPGVGQLNFTGYAPSLNLKVIPLTGSLVITGYVVSFIITRPAGRIWANFIITGRNKKFGKY